MLEFKQKAELRWRICVRHKDGTETPWSKWRSNLIMDAGLDKVGNVAGWATCWNTCIYGNNVSPVPVRRNSNPVTVSQAATTLTASGAFFVAGDVGRLWKFDSGAEMYITAFTDSTHVTVGVSGTNAGETGTVWYVNSAALSTVFSNTGSFTSGGGDNGTSVSGNVITMKRTFIGAAAGSPVTLTELGFSNSSTNSNLFDRDIISGGVSLLATDQPKIQAELLITMTPNVSTAAGNVGTGFDTSGNCIINALNTPGTNNGYISGVDATGASKGGTFFEPSQSSLGCIGSTSVALPAFSSGAPSGLPTLVQASSNSLGSYSAGNFFRDKTAVFSTATANGTIFSLLLGSGDGNICFFQRLTTSFTKTSAQTLTIVFRLTWQRILVN